jgi:hypothetical protein
MGIHFKQDSSLNDHARKLQRLVFEISITADAVPADKRQSSDMAGAALVRTEGKTAQADAMEDISALVAAPVDDPEARFAVLVDTSQNPPSKLYSASVTPSVGTISIEALEITPEGRIVLDLESDQSLETQSLSCTIVLEYKETA